RFSPAPSHGSRQSLGRLQKLVKSIRGEETMVRLLRAAGGGAVAMLALMSAAIALDYKEAPGFAAAVADGKLPPVAERLPAEPEVVTPLNEIGAYGGVLRFGLRGSSDHNHILRIVGNQGLVRWNPEFTAVI